MEKFVTAKNLTTILLYTTFEEGGTTKYMSPEKDVILWFDDEKNAQADSKNKKSIGDVAKEIAEYIYRLKIE